MFIYYIFLFITNSLSEHIKFILDMEKDNQFPFLDVLLTKKEAREHEPNIGHDQALVGICILRLDGLIRFPTYAIRPSENLIYYVPKD